ncbi:tetratricopeptide repeat protein [Bacteroidota bacterium]
MKKIIFLFLLLISTRTIATQDDVKLIMSMQSERIKELELGEKTMSQEIVELKIETSHLKATITEVAANHNEQVKYYETLINLIFWVVGFVILFIGAAFSVLIWVFKKPQELWEKVVKTKEDASLLLERLEIQIQHHESMFILGEKGLYDYTPEDWKTVQIYAERSYSVKEDLRTANEWYFIGLINYQKKIYNKAIEAFKEAIKLKKDFQDAYKDLGNTYCDIGKFDEAIKCYENVISLNPLSFKAYNNLGIAYTSKEEYDNALEFFKKSIKLFPTQGFIYTNMFELHLICDQDFPQDFIDHFEQTFKDNLHVYSKYQMLNTLKSIKHGSEMESKVESWKANGYELVQNEDFSDIDKWVEKVSEESIKNNLKKAVTFFKSKVENIELC